MTDDIFLEAPGFRGRLIGSLGELQVIDAQVTGDIAAHVADSDEFAVILSGRFEILLDGTPRSGGPGDCIFVGRGQDHAIRVLEAGRLILIGKIQ